MRKDERHADQDGSKCRRGRRQQDRYRARTSQCLGQILEEIDRKARLRQAAINALMPSLPVEQTSLKVHHPEADVTREMVLPREAMLVIDKIFTSPSGRVDLKTLTDAHKAYFRTPVKQKEMHGYLEEMMRNWLIDYCVHLRSKQGHDYWRLTPRTTDSLRRTEPYESYFKNSFTNFKSVVDDIFAQGTLHDYEWRGEDNHKPYRIVRMVNSPNSLPVSELRNEFGKITVTPCSIEWPQALLGESDITAYELFSDLGATTKDGINRHQNQVESEITLKEDCVEERLRVLAASAIGYYPDEIIRILPPGEMDTIRKKLESLMIDPYNSH